MDYITKTDLVGIGYDLTSVPDADLAAICKNASLVLDGYVGMSLAEQEVTEKTSGICKDDKILVFPKVTPVQTVDNIRVYYDLQNSLTIAGTSAFIDNDRCFIAIPYSGTEGESYFIEANYTGGYETIPEDVKQAAILIAAPMLSDWFMGKNPGFHDLQEVQDGLLKFSRKKSPAIPETAKLLLAKYKRVR